MSCCNNIYSLSLFLCRSALDSPDIGSGCLKEEDRGPVKNTLFSFEDGQLFPVCAFVHNMPGLILSKEADYSLN